MSFSSQINIWAVKAPKQLNDIKRRVCLSLFRSVVLDTPVAEGTLRSAWECTTRAPAIGIPNNSDPITQIIGKIGESKLEEAVFLTNNLPYAYPIEFLGWSHTKAPQGMVRKNALRFQQIVKSEVRRQEK